MPGFVKVLTAKDLPPGGVNNVVSPNFSQLPEEVSYSGVIGGKLRFLIAFCRLSFWVCWSVCCTSTGR